MSGGLLCAGIQPFATNGSELTLQVIVKEHVYTTLTFNDISYNKETYGGPQQYQQLNKQSSVTF